MPLSELAETCEVVSRLSLAKVLSQGLVQFPPPKVGFGVE